MKKTIITTFALCATFCAVAQNTPAPVKSIQQFSIGQNALFNVQNGGANYSINIFTRADKETTPTKGFYTKIGLAIPENRPILFSSLGLSLPASKTNIKRFIDIGIVCQLDFKSKTDPEMYNMLGMETAYRFDNIGALQLFNIRLGLIAGYHNYKTLPAGAVINDVSKAGFRIMPTLSVSINLYNRKIAAPNP